MIQEDSDLARKELTEEKMEELRRNEKDSFIWRLYRMGYPLQDVMKTARVSSIKVAEVVMRNVNERLRKQIVYAGAAPAEDFRGLDCNAVRSLESTFQRLWSEMEALHGEKLEGAESKVADLEEYVATLERDISRLAELADGLDELEETRKAAEEERKRIFGDDDPEDPLHGKAMLDEAETDSIPEDFNGGVDDGGEEDLGWIDDLAVDGDDVPVEGGSGCMAGNDEKEDCTGQADVHKEEMEMDRKDEMKEEKKTGKEHVFHRIFSREGLPWTVVALVVVIVALCLVGVSSYVMDSHDEPAYAVRIDRIETNDGHDVRASVAAREYEKLASRMADAVEARKKTVETLQVLEGEINDLMFLYQRNVEDLSGIQAEIAYLDNAMEQTLQAR